MHQQYNNHKCFRAVSEVRVYTVIVWQSGCMSKTPFAVYPLQKKIRIFVYQYHVCEHASQIYTIYYNYFFPQYLFIAVWIWPSSAPVALFFDVQLLVDPSDWQGWLAGQVSLECVYFHLPCHLIHKMFFFARATCNMDICILYILYPCILILF